MGSRENLRLSAGYQTPQVQTPGRIKVKDLPSSQEQHTRKTALTVLSWGVRRKALAWPLGRAGKQ